MIDGIAYFTNGACIPSGSFEAIPYFTNGLLIPSTSSSPLDGGGGIMDARARRRKFVKRAKRDAEDAFVLLSIVSIIDSERDY